MNVLNDDFTTVEFVIMVMMTVFNKTMAEAEDIAETILFLSSEQARMLTGQVIKVSGGHAI